MLGIPALPVLFCFCFFSFPSFEASIEIKWNPGLISGSFCKARAKPTAGRVS